MNIKKFKNRLFGRTRGRSNKKIDILNYKKILVRFKVEKINEFKNNILDIGTGYGETSIYLSKKYSYNTIIACEKYVDGNLNLIKNIENNKIKNIFIHPGNVHELLDSNKTKRYFELVWIFFPDPWPKKKHFKRRLISFYFLEKINNYIKKNGEIWIVTDSISYSKHILQSIYQAKKFYKWINQNELHMDLKDYCDLETKFYKKAIISGAKPSLFILKKL